MRIGGGTSGSQGFKTVAWRSARDFSFAFCQRYTAIASSRSTACPLKYFVLLFLIGKKR